MAIPAELESISSQDGDGSIAYGIHREVITFDSAGAGVGTSNYQLKAEQSGALIVFNTTSGTLLTLPTPVKGIWFEFINQIARTGNATKIVCNDITAHSLIGSILSSSETVGQSMDVFTGNGSTHDQISMNGTTTGGEVGARFVLTALSSTQWLIKGTNYGSGGAVGDPFTSG